MTKNMTNLITKEPAVGFVAQHCLEQHEARSFRIDPRDAFRDEIQRHGDYG